MTGAAVGIVTELLQNLGNPEAVQRLVSADAEYVSLNYENPSWHRFCRERAPTMVRPRSPTRSAEGSPGGPTSGSSRPTSSATMSDATAASFRSAGAWTVHGDPTGQPKEVPAR
jgi:hypothetical protein